LQSATATTTREAPRREAAPPRSLARSMLLPAPMKDIVLIGVSVAFFALSWLYVKSFDHI
jgi:hypothetical protein